MNICLYNPDLDFTVFTVSKFVSNPTTEYIIAIKQLYQYLQAIKDLKIIYYDGLT